MFNTFFQLGAEQFFGEALQLRACVQIALQMLENSCHGRHCPEV